MMRDARSFFERLTGGETIEEEEEFDDHDEVFEDEEDEFEEREEIHNKPLSSAHQYEEEGELAVDLYETNTDLFIKTVVAGVRPDELDISITREQVTIRGNRAPERGFDGPSYHIQEVYWGPFSRTVDLPEEIEVDEAEAVAKHGLLILRLPKINKNRETKLKVKTG